MTPLPSYRIIYLTQGQIALVDADIYDEINQWNWYADWKPSINGFYACRKSKMVNGSCRHTILMHRYILGLDYLDSRLVDHRNPERTLDNRRENLRIVTYTQNALHRRISSRNKSGFKGVYPQDGKWAAITTINGKQKYLGLRGTPKDAYTDLYLPAMMEYDTEFRWLQPLDAEDSVTSEEQVNRLIREAKKSEEQK